MISNIPKVIYLTSYTKDIPDYVLKNWKTLNPEYEIKLYDNIDCIKFLGEEFEQEHIDIFNYIDSGPIKADFWRVCILYAYGGVYSDIDIEPIVPINDFIEDNVTFLTSDSIFRNALNPHFIIATKNNIILKKCIDMYVDMYRNKVKYEYWKWSIVNILSPIINEYLSINIKFIQFQSNEYKNNICNKLTRYFSFITNWDIFKIYSNKIFYSSNNKYQFLQENLTYNPNYIYCTYKGKRILNNRYNNYDRHKHKFI